LRKLKIMPNSNINLNSFSYHQERDEEIIRCPDYYSLRYSEWLANLVPVRKKSGEIRLRVDFRNLNKCSLKDNYPMPKMDPLL
jgi:hypothetical protein